MSAHPPNSATSADAANHEANGVRGLYRFYDSAPKTVNTDTRTVEVVASTGAQVMRRYGRPDGSYGPWIERLDMGGIDLSRFVGGAVLRDHIPFTDALIGVVETASVNGGKLSARVRFSDRTDVAPLWGDVQSGILRSVSVGYQVQQWAHDGIEAGLPIFKAARWAPYELSFVAVGADADAGTRSLPIEKGSPMVEQAVEHAGTETLSAATRSLPTDVSHQVSGAAPTAPLNRMDVPDPAVGTPEHARAVRSLCSRHLGEAGPRTALDILERGMTLANAQTTILNELARRSEEFTVRNHVRVDFGESYDAPAGKRTAFAEALAARYAPGFKPSDRARSYMGMSLLDMARSLLDARGEHVGYMAPGKLYQRAMTSSDFPGLLVDAGTKILQTAYEAAPAGIRTIARQSSAPDFRAKAALRLSNAPTFVKVSEGGEFKQGGMAEAKEAYKLDTYGRVIVLTRQAIVNDDLGAFADLNTKFGWAAAEFVASFLVDLVFGTDGTGPQMNDTKALFCADHGNLAETGGVIDVDSLGAGREAMRLQRDIDGGSRINVVPKYLVVPAALETKGEQVLTAIQANSVAAANPWPGKLELAVDPRLDDKAPGAWYLAADPAFGTVEYSYLDGATGPDVVMTDPIEVDGLKVRARLDFGAGILDWRGMWRNPGAVQG